MTIDNIGLPVRHVGQPRPRRNPAMSQDRALVKRVDILNGNVIWQTNPRERWVYTRPDGSHYIITLGEQEDVFLQEDGTFIEYQIGHAIGGGIAI